MFRIKLPFFRCTIKQKAFRHLFIFITLDRIYPTKKNIIKVRHINIRVFLRKIKFLIRFIEK